MVKASSSSSSSRCCEKKKEGLKKGSWTPEEDRKLIAYIQQHGHGSWHDLPSKAGLKRCGKSCRLRWANYLRPDIKRGKFSLEEDQTIIQLHAFLGNRWSVIASHLPKRTDNEIKNYWNTHLKKRLTRLGIDPTTHKPQNDVVDSHITHMAQWESARLQAEARLSNPNPNTNSKTSFTRLVVSKITPHASSSSSSSSSSSGMGMMMMHRHSMYAMMLATTHDDDILSPTSTLTFPNNHSIMSNTISMELPLRFGYVHNNDFKPKGKEIIEIQKNNKSQQKVVEIMGDDDNNNIGIMNNNNNNNIGVQDHYDEAMIEETQYWSTVLNWEDDMPFPDLP